MTILQNKIASKVDELNRVLSQEKETKIAFENYCDLLDEQYQQIENEYQDNIELLEEKYDELQDERVKDIEDIKIELQKICDTRAAAIEALKKEKEIEENSHLYSIELNLKEKHDIQTLESIKSELSNPRILSVLIWQTYYRDKVTQLCNNVLGTKQICGIYKITNQKSKECYIGQSVNVQDRWKTHCKCGLGIDTPIGNQLYKSMQEDGLYNFTFELLMECSKVELNEKEKYFISLYDSYNYGYNKTSGNK